MNKTPQEQVNNLLKKRQASIDKAAESMLSNVLGKAVISILEKGKPLSSATLLQYLQDELSDHPKSLAASWHQYAVDYLARYSEQ
ncbi:hypothetical protein EKN56_06425 [Limnobaculum zhutongyuii]|uniref:Uncharacterized protein n=1 Tax=Limnobaculum zhutongyuii TaxID=2498113 RepID=A0A411WIQ0_9GAMM|nr:hypothetical protein [Limnobaculum zhutongyuii]QBH96065.1 hypothetical protein EKN56_06425 [Limnobaculum zhutongyuii]TQS86152.1 hypothetical protein ELQ32_20270 [Limnobaculum zhutongyuii]